ncbi:MAG: AbrB family transcriptional regulator [Nanoarchaeota archaeon]|nr:AbrB family transcriptional regulator [Nanoarchaeota archaeon]MBU4117078.1 AbrB family transcriptional regulator [Nanoarchaeota archaeon]
MEKILSFDKQGRLYLPEDMRKFLFFKTLIAKTIEEGLLLKPLEDDPVKALEKLGKIKLKGKSIKQLKKEARIEIEKNATEKIRRY